MCLWQCLVCFLCLFSVSVKAPPISRTGDTLFYNNTSNKSMTLWNSKIWFQVSSHLFFTCQCRPITNEATLTSRNKTAFVLISVEICAAVSGKLFKDLILVFWCIFWCVCKYDLPTPYSLPCMFGASIYDAVLYSLWTNKARFQEFLKYFFQIQNICFLCRSTSGNNRFATFCKFPPQELGAGNKKRNKAPTFGKLLSF